MLGTISYLNIICSAQEAVHGFYVNTVHFYGRLSLWILKEVLESILHVYWGVTGFKRIHHGDPTFWVMLYRGSMLTLEQPMEAAVTVWMSNIPHRLMCLDTWFPDGGTVSWEGCELVRSWGLVGGKVSLRWGHTLGIIGWPFLGSASCFCQIPGSQK